VILTFTAILVAYLVSSANRTRAIETVVEERTLELHRLNETLGESQARASAVVDNIVDGIITIDELGTIQSFNAAAESIFGYAMDDVIGRNVNMLMPAPYHDAHDGFLAGYKATSDKKIIGIGREVEGLRTDGSTFPLDLAVSEIHLGENRLYTGIVRDITERKEIDRMKNEFISTVSHELRTPLTSIMCSLGLVRGGGLSELPKQVGNLIDIVHNNSERLVRLINDILDIEKIASGKLDDRVEPLDIASMVDLAIADNQGYCEQFSVTCVFLGQHHRIMVSGNRDRLLQVLTNLISNAAKFSPQGSRVEVSITPQDGMVRVDVTDHGPGIEPAFQGRIFQQFAQADSSDHRRIGGTGLGLSICKAIVESYGGQDNACRP
jgi:PAS domain S-box-containing protein